MQVDSLSAHSNTKLLKQQTQQFHPRRVLVTDLDAYNSTDWSDLPAEVELLAGPDRICELVTDPEVDTVVSAIVGSAGLIGTWAAIEAGKTVALANKETLVVGGPLITGLAKRTGATILPVDSEHGAIFQSLQAGNPSEVRRVVLTASGGPFRTYNEQQLRRGERQRRVGPSNLGNGPQDNCRFGNSNE